jgi:LytS/YehU family sensor histidine kinase
VVGIWLLQRPAVGPIILLWPALYALHAILIIAGVPILFLGRWDSLNMIIPTIGYGLIASLIAHIYSRIQLRRLRCMTRGNLSDEAFEETRP